MENEKTRCMILPACLLASLCRFFNNWPISCCASHRITSRSIFFYRLSGGRGTAHPMARKREAYRRRCRPVLLPAARPSVSQGEHNREDAAPTTTKAPKQTTNAPNVRRGQNKATRPKSMASTPRTVRAHQWRKTSSSLLLLAEEGVEAPSCAYRGGALVCRVSLRDARASYSKCAVSGVQTHRWSALLTRAVPRAA